MAFSPMPKAVASKLTDITAEFLHDHNIRLLMLDFDNTIVPYTTDLPTKEVTEWFAEMKSSDIQLCIVSNSKKGRVPVFCSEYGLDCITHARKPFSDGIRRCLRKYSVDIEKAALVGDQIYTDVLGANAAGVMPILVDAIDNHNFWLKARGVLEIPFRYFARKRRIQDA